MILLNSKCLVEGGNLLLPDDILKIISNKLLRLILDEVEDDNCLSLKREKSVYESLYNKYVKTLPRYYKNSNNIDFIIKLIMAKNIGANPNLKNYKGHTILHLLIDESLHTSYLGTEDSEYQILLEKINLLHKYSANNQMKDFHGNTISHLLIPNWINENYSGSCEPNTIEFLQNLGMNINEVKNNEGNTAYEIGKMLIGSKYNNYIGSVIIYHQLKLDELLFKEHRIKFELLNKDLEKLKSDNQIGIKKL